MNNFKDGDRVIVSGVGSGLDGLGTIVKWYNRLTSTNGDYYVRMDSYSYNTIIPDDNHTIPVSCIRKLTKLELALQ